MEIRFPIGALLLAAACIGCGARTDLAEADGTDRADGGGACGIEAPDAVLVCQEILPAPPERCVLRDPRGEYRIECDGEACRWYTEGALRCECNDLDFANRCLNGVPFCIGWQRYIDFSLLDRCP